MREYYGVFALQSADEDRRRREGKAQSKPLTARGKHEPAAIQRAKRRKKEGARGGRRKKRRGKSSERRRCQKSRKIRKEGFVEAHDLTETGTRSSGGQKDRRDRASTDQAQALPGTGQQVVHAERRKQ